MSSLSTAHLYIFLIALTLLFSSTSLAKPGQIIQDPIKIDSNQRGNVGAGFFHGLNGRVNFPHDINNNGGSSFPSSSDPPPPPSDPPSSGSSDPSSSGSPDPPPPGSSDPSSSGSSSSSDPSGSNSGTRSPNNQTDPTARTLNAQTDTRDLRDLRRPVSYVDNRGARGGHGSFNVPRDSQDSSNLSRDLHDSSNLSRDLRDALGLARDLHESSNLSRDLHMPRDWYNMDVYPGMMDYSYAVSLPGPLPPQPVPYPYAVPPPPPPPPPPLPQPYYNQESYPYPVPPPALPPPSPPYFQPQSGYDFSYSYQNHPHQRQEEAGGRRKLLATIPSRPTAFPGQYVFTVATAQPPWSRHHCRVVPGYTRRARLYSEGQHIGTWNGLPGGWESGAGDGSVRCPTGPMDMVVVEGREEEDSGVYNGGGGGGGGGMMTMTMEVWDDGVPGPLYMPMY